MKEIILAGAFALSASTCLAQTATSPEPAPSEAASPVDPAPVSQQGGPANLCQEILAFMKAPPPETVKPAAAGTGASGGSGSNSAQAVTGQKGVATDAPEPGKDNAQAGSVANAPQKDSRAAPVPPADVTSTPKESVLTMEAAQQLAATDDIAQCQKTAREMRIAGIAMPSPLIALAALDLQYQQKSGLATGTANPPGAE